MAAPRSGYELKMFFAATPAAVYEPSSGAVYPALRRLENRRLLNSELAESSGKRLQRRFRATQAGADTHYSWLRQSVDPSTIGRDLGVHLMRFVMAEGNLTATETLAFLRDLGDALDHFVDNMEVFARETPLTGRHPALALEHGIAVHRASSKWVRDAITTLTAGR